jgi:hypothetical protein
MTGSNDLETLYSWYKAEHGFQESAKKKVEDIKKGKKKIRPVSVKGKSGRETKSSGVDKKYKYASRPEFKEFVQMYKENVSPLVGRKLTMKEIDDLCKTEYQTSK